MSDYKPVKIRKKRRGNPELIRLLTFRVLPIVLVTVVSVCAFTIFDRKIANIIADRKYEALAERGDIDDPTRDDYDALGNVDWLSLFNASDPDGFDPLQLSPLDFGGGLRPSSTLDSTALEESLGYKNMQSTVWSIHDSVNPDVLAWLYIPGMGINYPIAQDQGDEFYLGHSYDRADSTAGTLFISPNASISNLSRNLVVHGHNMRDGTMFATLNNYLIGTRSFFEAHRYIFLDTLYGTYRYQIFSVYKVDAEDTLCRMLNFGGNVEFVNWCAELSSRSAFSTTNSYKGNDRILTLSTCDATNKYRIIVHAQMVYPEPDPADDIDHLYLSENPEPMSEEERRRQNELAGYDPDATPAPTATPKPTATPAPKATEAPKANPFVKDSKWCISTSDGKSTLRLRKEPSTTSDQVNSLAHGTTVTVLTTADPKSEWVYVLTGGTVKGYVKKAYLVPESEFAYTVPDTEVKAPTTNIVTPAAG